MWFGTTFYLQGKRILANPFLFLIELWTSFPSFLLQSSPYLSSKKPPQMSHLLELVFM